MHTTAIEAMRLYCVYARTLATIKKEKMKTQCIQIIIILFFSTNFGLSQTDSPVGKWILTEHLVLDSFDNKNGYWLEKNVFNNEFDAYLIFEPNGEIYYQNGDSVKVGKWKLKRKGKKLKIKYGFMSGGIQISKNPINFEAPLYFSDNFEHLYTKTKHRIERGESKFIRILGKESEIEKSLFVGKWKTVKYKERKKEILITDPDIFELKLNNEATSFNSVGKWKVNGKKLTIDFRQDKDEEDTFFIKTIEIVKINKDEMIYLEKEGRISKLVYSERIK